VPLQRRGTDPYYCYVRPKNLLIWALAVAGAIVLAAASPVVLLPLSATSFDWTRLGDIGQAYGAASAILAGVALIGVALSLLLQSRQHRAETISAARERHLEIVKLALKDPALAACWGAEGIPPPGMTIEQA